MATFRAKYGPWALVTGASSGIGRQFARHLASRGLNLALVARRGAILEGLGHELSGTTGVATKAIAADLVQPDAAAHVIRETEELEIGLVVSNAGAELHGAFLDQDAGRSVDLVRLNALAPLKLVHHYGGLMRGRRKGGIVIVSSLTAHGGTPYLATYSATKAFLLVLGESLYYEMKPYQVDVTVVAPGITRTPMIERAAESGVDFSRIPLPCTEVEPVVAAALHALGRSPSVIPGAGNRFIMLMHRLLPRKQVVRLYGAMLGRAFPLP